MPSTSLAETLSLSTSTSTTAAATRVAQNSFHGLGASSHRAFLNDLNHDDQSSASGSEAPPGVGAAYARHTTEAHERLCDASAGAGGKARAARLARGADRSRGTTVDRARVAVERLAGEDATRPASGARETRDDDMTTRGARGWRRDGERVEARDEVCAREGERRSFGDARGRHPAR